MTDPRLLGEFALADLLLVDGNPLTDIELIEEPNKNFLVIMQDGRVYQDGPDRPIPFPPGECPGMAAGENDA